jgi:sugar lactone lactonase YvrE
MSVFPDGVPFRNCISRFCNPAAFAALSALAVLLAAGAARAQQSATITLPDSIVEPGTQVKWFKKILQYCEGPATDQADGTLYFTEQRDNNTLDWPIWKINPGNPSDTGARWVSPSNQSNGLFVDGQGRVIAAQKGKIVRYAKSGAVDSVLVTSGNGGVNFGQANDFSMGKNGALYFTDLGSQIFYLDASRKLKVAISGLSNVNGIEWIEEDNAVYANAGGRLNRFDVGADGSLSNTRNFAALNGGDGMEVDSHGNFYDCSYTEGVMHVINAKGIEIGKITFQMQAGPYDTRSGSQGNVDNCHFGGGDGKTLYCTGDGGVFTIQMKIPGRKWAAAVGLAAAGRPIRDYGTWAPPTGLEAFRADGRWWEAVAGPQARSPRLPVFRTR